MLEILTIQRDFSGICFGLGVAGAAATPAECVTGRRWHRRTSRFAHGASSAPLASQVLSPEFAGKPGAPFLSGGSQ
jgi:hypothetical protein